MGLAKSYRRDVDVPLEHQIDAEDGLSDVTGVEVYFVLRDITTTVPVEVLRRTSFTRLTGEQLPLHLQLPEEKRQTRVLLKHVLRPDDLAMLATGIPVKLEYQIWTRFDGILQIQEEGEFQSVPS